MWTDEPPLRQGVMKTCEQNILPNELFSLWHSIYFQHCDAELELILRIGVVLLIKGYFITV